MKDDFGSDGLLDQFISILAPEWRVTAQEGICDDPLDVNKDNKERIPHGPQVGRFAMASLKKDFGSCVAIRSGHGSQSLIFRLQRFGDSEIGKNEFRVVFGSAIEKILGLEV
jgi:hypothetical protein